MGADYIQILLAVMIGLAFLMGAVTFSMGVFKIFSRASGGEVQTLAAETARLVNKGLTDQLAGLVGQSSELMNSVNQLVRTERGSGVTLVGIGIIVMAGSVWAAYLIAQNL